MAIPDVFTLYLNEVNASASRKTQLKNAFAKEIKWEAEIDGEPNPVTFQEAFNNEIWRKVRETCRAGQIKLNQEAAEPVDEFSDLVE